MGQYALSRLYRCIRLSTSTTDGARLKARGYASLVPDDQVAPKTTGGCKLCRNGANASPSLLGRPILPFDCVAAGVIDVFLTSLASS